MTRLNILKWPKGKSAKMVYAGAAWLVIVCAIVYWGNDLFILCEGNKPSESIGTPGRGRLVSGKRLPSRGLNFVAYSYLGVLLGRNSVHEKVRRAVLEAYQEAGSRDPDKQFVYGETSWPRGGRFWPHKTHQNGLSVDFMVPVVDNSGRSVRLPCSIFTKWGYRIEFDENGSYKGYRIDFDAMAMHLEALSIAAGRNGLEIDFVIFDPGLQPLLFASQRGESLKTMMRFSSRPSWVRHDEHYHVDFRLKETTDTLNRDDQT